MSLYKYLLLAVLFFNAAFSFSAPVDTVREKYVESYPDRFYIKPILTIRNLSLELESRYGNSKINYHPNGDTYLGLGLYVFDLGMEFSFRIPQNSKSIERFGETEYFDLQSNIYAKRWGADLAIQKYEGFYLSNPNAHYPAWKNNEPFPQRNDLIISNVSANVFYILNHRKFSYRSAYNQADRQKEGGGSFIIGINYFDQGIIADSSLIPVNSRYEFDLEEFRRVDYSALGVLPGYTHSFIFRYFYLNLSMAVGPSHVWSNYTEDFIKIEDRQVRATLHIRAALGYNSPRWFTGLTFVNQTSNLLTEHVDISGESGNVRFFIGYRFKEIGFLKKDIL